VHEVKPAYNDFLHQLYIRKLDVGDYFCGNKSYILRYQGFVWGSMHIGTVKSIAEGFFAMATIIALFSIVTLIRSGDSWLGMLYLLILVMPVSAAGVLWNKTRKTRPSTTTLQKLTQALFALLGIALACWSYDLATTCYAIDIAKVATEINPLGWPWGALGAFTYYGPTTLFTYVLLVKIKQKMSVYAAIPMVFVALLMGSMNLNAGIGNFQFFVSTAHIAASIRMDLLAIVAVADLTYLAILASLWSGTALAGTKLAVKKN
jgi:hypothetical protein